MEEILRVAGAEILRYKKEDPVPLGAVSHESGGACGQQSSANSCLCKPGRLQSRYCDAFRDSIVEVFVMKRQIRSRLASPQENGSRTSAMALDFKDYVPAHLTYLANKISSGASAIYRPRFGVGITEWRIMALLAGESWVSPRKVSEVTGLDKGAVSRSIQSLKEGGHVEVRPDQYDRRSQSLALTAKGLALHDRMVQLARKREQRLLTGFTAEERALLRQFLSRMESQVPAANALRDEAEPGQ